MKERLVAKVHTSTRKHLRGIRSQRQRDAGREGAAETTAELLSSGGVPLGQGPRTSARPWRVSRPCPSLLPSHSAPLLFTGSGEPLDLQFHTLKRSPPRV